MSKNCPNSKGKGKNNQPRGNKAPYRKYGGNKNQRRAEEVADDAAAMTRSKSNPVSFYTDKFPQFSRDAANIQFAQPLGSKYSLKYAADPNVTPPSSGVTEWKFDTADAGVMRIVFSPSIGVSYGYDSPINRSSVNYYARVRSTQKAFGDYDHQDLTIMTVALDSACMFHALGMRIYGMLRDMTPINRYYPRALMAASGMSFQATVQQIQDFRAYLNEYAIRIEQFAIPKGITFIERHRWMCEGIYTDSQSRKSQTYIFVPRGFWKYNNTANTGSTLEWVDYIKPEPATTNYTIETFMEIGEKLMNALSNDADAAMISGDLYAYYGNERMVLPYIDEGYQILPTYDRTVLSQIENATLMGDWASGYVPYISQTTDINNGAIIFQPQVDVKCACPGLTTRLNMHMDQPTPDDILEATRLVCTLGGQLGDTGNRWWIASCGSEIPHYADVFVTNPSTGLPRSRRVDSMWKEVAIENLTPQFISNLLEDLTFAMSFDWAPRFEYIVVYNSSSNMEYGGCSWDIDNMSIIPANYVEIMNEAALYNEFAIPTR